MFIANKNIDLFLEDREVKKLLEGKDLENKVIAKVNNLLPSEIDVYDLLIDTLYNYHCIANYTEVEEYFYLLKYDLNKEELMYTERRLNYLKSHGKLELKPFI